MSLTDEFIGRLESLKDGDRARLRQLAGQTLDHTLEGFDLFTGLWWPLRQTSPRAPERRSAWLVAKLYGAYRVRHIRDPSAALPCVLGRSEPPVPSDLRPALLTSEPPRQPARREAFLVARRCRRRFDALLLSPLGRLEPHLRWALSVAREAVGQGREPGIDWVELLDDLRLWDRGAVLRRGKHIREQWAEQYLNPFTRKGNDHVD